jgi:hypothetical protein
MLTPVVILDSRKAMRRRGRESKDAPAPPPPPPPPAALTLDSAVYDAGNVTLTLTFDRAIDVSAFDGSTITLDDGEFAARRFDGTGGSEQPTPQSLRVYLLDFGSSIKAGVHLTVTSENGIVAADDAMAWEGCSELELPFP